jgi:hypothetical protein
MDFFTASVAALDMVSDFIVIAQWLVLGLTGWAVAGTCIMTLAGITYMTMFIDAFGLTEKRNYWLDNCGGLWTVKWGNRDKNVKDYIVFGAFHLLVTFPITLILSITVGQLCPFALWAYNLRQAWRGEDLCVPEGFRMKMGGGMNELLVGQMVVLREYMADQVEPNPAGLLPGELGIIVEKVQQDQLRTHLVRRQNSLEDFMEQAESLRVQMAQAVLGSKYMRRFEQKRQREQADHDYAYKINTSVGSSCWYSHTQIEAARANQFAAMMDNVATKVAKHALFLAETFVESVPQSLLQLAFIVISNQVSTINVISISLSVLSVISKAYTMSYSIDLGLFAFKMSLACADIVSLYFLVATLPTCIDASFDYYNPVIGTSTNLLGGVWLWMELIFWMLFAAGMSGFVWANIVKYYEYLRYHFTPRKTKLLTSIGALAASPFVLLPAVVGFGILFVPFVVVFETVKLLILSWFLFDLEQSKIKCHGFSALMLSFLRGGHWKRKLAHVHICITEHVMARFECFSLRSRYSYIWVNRAALLENKDLVLTDEERRELTLMTMEGNAYRAKHSSLDWAGHAVPIKVHYTIHYTIHYTTLTMLCRSSSCRCYAPRTSRCCRRWTRGGSIRRRGEQTSAWRWTRSRLYSTRSMVPSSLWQWRRARRCTS